MKKTVVLGLLGTNLDAGLGSKRWNHWRPSVALCQHDDLLIDRFELLYQVRFAPLAEQIEQDLRTISPETELQHHCIEFDDPWDFEQVYAALYEFARSYAFDTEHETYLVHITTGTHVAQICCYLLTEARFFPAQLLQTSPPARHQYSGPGTFRIIDLDLSRYDQIALRFQRDAEAGADFLKAGIATRDSTFNALIQRIEQVAIRSRAPLLLTGPTGAGKSQLARRIYQLKRRRNQVAGALVEVNCATLHGDAAMSALFGHVKGAFTGAMRDRGGLLRAADGGVLFLDEIGELGIDEQTMLLRALEEKCFFPLGADQERRSNFQLLAGTNRNLQMAVREGRFREDLLARINLWSFRLPGLCERRADIEPNLDFELERYARETGYAVRFNKEARDRYLTFALAPEAQWRANFRDLSASVTRLATLAPGGRVNADLVDEEIQRLKSYWQAVPPDASTQIDELLPTPLDLFDEIQLRQVLQLCRESKTLSEAGRRLFAVSRAQKKAPNDADRLRKYLTRFGIDWGAIQSHAQT